MNVFYSTLQMVSSFIVWPRHGGLPRGGPAGTALPRKERQSTERRVVAHSLSI